MIKGIICAVVASLFFSGCSTPVVQPPREIIVKCVTNLPEAPVYTFHSLKKATTASESAEAVYTLYEDWVKADAYGRSLYTLIVPCQGGSDK